MKQKRPAVLIILTLGTFGVLYVLHRTATDTVLPQVIATMKHNQSYGHGRHMECTFSYKIAQNIQLNYASSCRGAIPSNGTPVLMACSSDDKNQRYICKGTW